MLLLLAADRVNAGEAHRRSFLTLRPDNPITETWAFSEPRCHPILALRRQAHPTWCTSRSTRSAWFLDLAFALANGGTAEDSGAMTHSDTPYDRVRKLPKEFKPLRTYDKETRRGLAHTPEYDQRMQALKERFQHWLLEE